jgi:hypothetical protein
MVRSVVSKVMWLGRATVFLVGLAVILAVIFGVASMAFAANGDPWRLGRTNVATAITSLGGKLGVNGPMVRITNNNNGTNDTALSLNVQSGEAPMRVNSNTRVDSLNADLLDGQDASGFAQATTNAFVRNSTYRAEDPDSAGTLRSDGTHVISKSCDTGDRLLAGGPANVRNTSTLLESFLSSTTTWSARINNNGLEDNWTVVVLCADQ